MTKSLEQLNQEFQVLRAQAENILKEDNYRIIAPSSEDDNSKFITGLNLLFKNPEDAVAVAKYLELAWLLAKDQIPADYDRNGIIHISSNPFVEMNVLVVDEGVSPPARLRISAKILPDLFDNYVTNHFLDSNQVDVIGDAYKMINKAISDFQDDNPQASSEEMISLYQRLFAEFARPLVLGVSKEESEHLQKELDQLNKRKAILNQTLEERGGRNQVSRSDPIYDEFRKIYHETKKVTFLLQIGEKGVFEKFSEFVKERFGEDPFGYEYYKDYLYKDLFEQSKSQSFRDIQHREVFAADRIIYAFAVEIFYRNHPLFKDVFVERQAKGYEDAIDTLFADKPEIAKKIRESFVDGDYFNLDETKWKEFHRGNGLISEASPKVLQIIGIPPSQITKGSEFA